MKFRLWSYSYNCESSNQIQELTWNKFFVLAQMLRCAWLAQLSPLMLFWPGTANCLSSAEWVLLLKVCCGNQHNEKRARGIVVFLTVFKANESSSFSCYLTFPHNSFQSRWLFIFPSVAGPDFDPGKAELHLKLCFFDVYPLFKSKFMLDTLRCKDESLFFLYVFHVRIVFFLSCLVPPPVPQSLLIIHIFCGAYFFENN